MCWWLCYLASHKAYLKIVPQMRYTRTGWTCLWRKLWWTTESSSSLGSRSAARPPPSSSSIFLSFLYLLSSTSEPNNTPQTQKRKRIRRKKSPVNEGKEERTVDNWSKRKELSAQYSLLDWLYYSSVFYTWTFNLFLILFFSSTSCPF